MTAITIIMNNRKFLILISLVLMGIVLAGAACASSQSLELYGVKLTIPDGYEEVTGDAVDNEIYEYDEFTVNAYYRGYLDNDNNYLGISVEKYSGDPSLDDLRFETEVDKEIGGVNGLYGYDDLHHFTYYDGDKVVMISANNISTIEEVMGANATAGEASQSAEAKVESVSFTGGDVSTVSMFDCVDVTGQIVMDLSSVDDAEMKLLKKNYKKEQTESKDIKDNSIGDLKWKVKIPGTTSEIKVSSASFDGDKVTLDVHGKIYEYSSPGGSGSINVDNYDNAMVKITFFDENSQEHSIIAK